MKNILAFEWKKLTVNFVLHKHVDPSLGSLNSPMCLVWASRALDISLLPYI